MRRQIQGGNNLEEDAPLLGKLGQPDLRGFSLDQSRASLEGHVCAPLGAAKLVIQVPQSSQLEALTFQPQHLMHTEAVHPDGARRSSTLHFKHDARVRSAGVTADRCHAAFLLPLSLMPPVSVR